MSMVLHVSGTILPLKSIVWCDLGLELADLDCQVFLFFWYLLLSLGSKLATFFWLFWILRSNL